MGSKAYSKKQLIIKFSKKLRTERLKKNLSQESLAYRSSITPQYLSLLERAERNPTLVTLEGLAHALGLNVCDLIRF